MNRTHTTSREATPHQHGSTAMLHCRYSIPRMITGVVWASHIPYTVAREHVVLRFVAPEDPAPLRGSPFNVGLSKRQTSFPVLHRNQWLSRGAPSMKAKTSQTSLNGAGAYVRHAQFFFYLPSSQPRISRRRPSDGMVITSGRFSGPSRPLCDGCRPTASVAANNIRDS